MYREPLGNKDFSLQVLLYERSQNSLEVTRSNSSPHQNAQRVCYYYRLFMVVCIATKSVNSFSSKLKSNIFAPSLFAFAGSK